MLALTSLVSLASVEAGTAEAATATGLWEVGEDDGGEWLASALVDEEDSCEPGSEPLALFV